MFNINSDVMFAIVLLICAICFIPLAITDANSRKLSEADKAGNIAAYFFCGMLCLCTSLIKFGLAMPHKIGFIFLCTVFVGLPFATLVYMGIVSTKKLLSVYWKH